MIKFTDNLLFKHLTIQTIGIFLTKLFIELLFMWHNVHTRFWMFTTLKLPNILYFIAKCSWWTANNRILKTALRQGSESFLSKVISLIFFLWELFFLYTAYRIDIHLFAVQKQSFYCIHTIIEFKTITTDGS